MSRPRLAGDRFEAIREAFLEIPGSPRLRAGRSGEDSVVISIGDACALIRHIEFLGRKLRVVRQQAAREARRRATLAAGELAQLEAADE